MNRTVRHVVLDTVMVLALVGAAVAIWVALVEPPCHDLRDLDGRCVALEEPPDSGGIGGRTTAGRFQAPELGLDVPLVELATTDGTLNPPTLTDAFLVLDTRTPDGGDRPRVVAMHAVRDGRAPGNAFFESGAVDPDVLVRPGDLLVVDGVEHEVTQVEVLTKAAATASPQIWGARPGGERGLVVITCLQRSGYQGPATENLVVHAVRA